jgi:hypothetical protein
VTAEVREEPRRHEAPPVRQEQPSYEAVREEQRREAQRLAREEQPVHEEPKYEEPKREEPKYEEPKREEPRIDSKALLESSGLVMIETDRSKAATIAPAVEEPQQHLGRPRRDRPKPAPQQEEELQQVETRK